jgi:hypothetical protein
MRSFDRNRCRFTEYTGLRRRVNDAGFSFSGNSELAGQSGGASVTFELALKGNNGFNNPVTITFTGVPAGVSFSPAAPFAIKPGSYPLTVNTPSDVTPGVYTITIQGSSGNLRHTATLTLIVA